MIASNKYAATTYAQNAWLPYMYWGVSRMKNEAPFADSFAARRFTGIKIPQPTTVKHANMCRSILVNLMKMAASSPTVSTSCCSFVRMRGGIQPKKPLSVMTGGACLLSACLARGAYTTLLYGRRKQKRAAMARERASDVAKEAKKASDASYSQRQ